MPHTGFHIDLPPSLAERLKTAAARSGESVETLVSRALEAWLGDDAADAEALAELKRRWAAVEAGEVVTPNERVAAWLKDWGGPRFRAWDDT